MSAVARADVLVVGAGMLGAAAAYHLARAGRRVVVLEASEPATGASGNSFAWVNSVRKEPEPYHRLNATGMAEYPRLATELGTDVGYRDGGSLEWAAPQEQKELRERVARLAGWGYAARFIPAADARRLEPGLAVPDGEVAFFDADGWVDAPRLVRSFLERAQARGAEVRRSTPVRALRSSGGRFDAVVTDAGEIHADRVLLCAGTSTEALLAPLGVRVPVRSVPGLLAVTSPPAVPLTRVVHVPGVHLRPDVTGGLLLGASDIDGFVTSATRPGPPPDFAQPLLDRARVVFPPARDAKIVAVRIGVRPMPGDGHTIAGPVPGVDGAWVLVTHSAVTMGPLLGRLIAEEIAGGAPNALLGPFRPSRFA